MRSIINDALAIISGCITIGLFFDFGYLTAEHKLSLRNLITREAHTQKRFENTFLDYIRAINEAVFGRFSQVIFYHSVILQIAPRYLCSPS